MLVRSIWAAGAEGQEGVMASQDFGISYTPYLNQGVGGWQIMPTTLLFTIPPHQIFRPSHDLGYTLLP